MTALEAMSFGTPIIASNRGALPEVIADCGIYIDPNKVKTISKAMEKIILESSLYKKLSYKSKKEPKYLHGKRQHTYYKKPLKIILIIDIFSKLKMVIVFLLS